MSAIEVRELPGAVDDVEKIDAASIDAASTDAERIDAASIDAVLQQLHWSVLEFGHQELRAGATRVDVGPGISFHYVAHGVAELRRAPEPHGASELHGEEQAMTIQAGDFVMLPHTGRTTFKATRDTVFLSGSLALNETGPITTRAMPAVLFTCGFRVDEPFFASILETMHREASSARAGSNSVVERLADVVASAAVRIWLERGCGNARAWLASAGDPHLGRALNAIHDDPGSPWTVESLARLARASRSQFAEQFRMAVGDTPAHYVTRVRMEHAERMLRAGVSVSDIAYRLGYESDEGFSRAFRRHAGMPPSRWRRDPIALTA